MFSNVLFNTRFLHQDAYISRHIQNLDSTSINAMLFQVTNRLVFYSWGYRIFGGVNHWDSFVPSIFIFLFSIDYY